MYTHIYSCVCMYQTNTADANEENRVTENASSSQTVDKREVIEKDQNGASKNNGFLEILDPSSSEDAHEHPIIRNRTVSYADDDLPEGKQKKKHGNVSGYLDIYVSVSINVYVGEGKWEM